MSERKRVAVLNFFPSFFPPKSGGELRSHHIYRNLGRYYDVEMVSPTHPFVPPEVVSISENVIEHRVPKTWRHAFLHRMFDKLGRFPECSAVVVSLASYAEKGFKVLVKELCSKADIVIHEFPFLFMHARKRPGQLLIYDAHNVEFDLQQSMLKGPLGNVLCHYVRHLESRACMESDLIFATSQEDRKRLIELYEVPPQKVFLAPNGVDVSSVKFASRSEKEEARDRLGLNGQNVLLFIGSFHPPNIEAVDFIISTLAPRLTEKIFIVAGNVTKAFQRARVPENVICLGRVSDEAKKLLLAAADVALNPMFSGSGTNLKMLDYMASGIPTIATPIGVRGLEVIDGEQAIVREAEHFEEQILRLLGDPILCEATRLNARRMMEERYDWTAITTDIHEQIECYFKSSGKLRVAVVNDFPIYPAKHGGQVRIYNLYKRLSERHSITYLSFDRTVPSLTWRLLVKDFHEIRLPKGLLQTFLEAALARVFGISVDDIVAMCIAGRNRRLKRLVGNVAAVSDIVIASHPYLYHLLRSSRKPKVYESHNLEFSLKRQMLPSFLARPLLELVRRREGSACRQSAMVFVTSEEQRDELTKFYGIPANKVFVVPNGIDVAGFHSLPIEERIRYKAQLGLESRPVIIFLGSGHLPNAQAGRWIDEVLAPRMRDNLFFIVGSVCHYLSRDRANVKLFYEVGDEEKKELLKIADIAINPMTSGSGTNVKMLDYLVAGVPVVTTPIGARGLKLIDGEHARICELEEFETGIQRVLQDALLSSQLARNGRRLVEERYDWSGIVESMDTLLRGELLSR